MFYLLLSWFSIFFSNRYIQILFNLFSYKNSKIYIAYIINIQIIILILNAIFRILFITNFFSSVLTKGKKERKRKIYFLSDKTIKTSAKW